MKRHGLTVRMYVPSMTDLLTRVAPTLDTPTGLYVTCCGFALTLQFVLAVTDPSAPGAKGMTGFVVDADAEGVAPGKKEINMGDYTMADGLTERPTML